jgi:hypothetical protein
VDRIFESSSSGSVQCVVSEEDFRDASILREALQHVQEALNVANNHMAIISHLVSEWAQSFEQMQQHEPTSFSGPPF